MGRQAAEEKTRKSPRPPSSLASSISWASSAPSLGRCCLPPSAAWHACTPGTRCGRWCVPGALDRDPALCYIHH